MRRRPILVLLLAVAVAALAAAALAVGQRGADQPAAEQPGAEPAAVFVAPDGLDTRSCRGALRACATLGQAYRAARPGEVIELAAGRYPPQQILADPAKQGREHVTIRPAPGADVEVEGLTLGSGNALDGPRHLTVRGLRTTYASARQQRPIEALPGTRDVVLEDIDAGGFTLWGVRDVTVTGGDWGPCYVEPGSSCLNSKIDAGPRGSSTRRVTVEKALFHDYRFGPACWEPGADCHFECLYVNAGEGVTVRDSTFRDCALFDVFVTISGPDAARVGQRGLTLARNTFETPWDESSPDAAEKTRASAVALEWCESSPHGYQDVLIEGNRFAGATGIAVPTNQECAKHDVRVVGNRLAWDGCDPRWTYDRNVWTTGLRSGTCSPTDTVAPG